MFQKLYSMNQETFLYTLPQWFIFSSLIVIAYGWVENKKVFRIIGSVGFILLGIFALYVISNGYFLASEFLTPEEIISEELEEEIIDEIPFLARIFPAYLSFLVSAIFAFPAIYFDWKDKKPSRLFIILSALLSLFGFFVIVGALRTL